MEVFRFTIVQNVYIAMISRAPLFKCAFPSSYPLFLVKSNLDVANRPGSKVHGHQARKDDNRLAQRGEKRRLVGNDEVAVAELIDQVHCLDGDRGAANSVEICLDEVDRRFGNRRLRDIGKELDVPVNWLACESFAKCSALLTQHPREAGRVG